MKKTLLAIASMALALTMSAAPSVASASSPEAPSASSVSASKSAPLSARRGKTKCVKGSGTGSGICYTFLSSRYKVTPVESVPLRNRSYKKKATMSCSFSKSVTKTTSYGGSATSSGEVNAVFGLAKLSLSVTVSKQVSQSSTSASSAAGTVTLKPREQVTCLRTYGSVIMRVEKYTYHSKGGTKKVYTTKIPSTLGVDIVD